MTDQNQNPQVYYPQVPGQQYAAQPQQPAQGFPQVPQVPQMPQIPQGYAPAPVQQPQQGYVPQPQYAPVPQAPQPQYQQVAPVQQPPVPPVYGGYQGVPQPMVNAQPFEGETQDGSSTDANVVISGIAPDNLPEGRYNLRVSFVKVKDAIDNKTGNVKMLNGKVCQTVTLRWEVLNGEFTGQKISTSHPTWTPGGNEAFRGLRTLFPNAAIIVEVPDPSQNGRPREDLRPGKVNDLEVSAEVKHDPADGGRIFYRVGAMTPPV